MKSYLVSIHHYCYWITLLSLFLSACSDYKHTKINKKITEGNSSLSKGQVIARIDSYPITTQDLNQRLARLPAMIRRSYEPLERRRELLEAMIRFELLARQAKAHGLAEHSSVKIAYAHAIQEAILAQQAHTRQKQNIDPQHQDPVVLTKPQANTQHQFPDEIKLLFLAPELIALQGAMLPTHPQPDPQPFDGEQP